MPPAAAWLLLAIDPGRAKCGVAVLDGASRVLLQRVVLTGDLVTALQEIVAIHPPTTVVLGDRTGQEAVAEAVRQALPAVPVELVDEHHSSLEARRRYFAEHPPRGWRRLLPSSLQTPPVPVDDWVAVILGERYLAQRG